jgi:tetratricopeptide (TPR) repeat protein
MGLVLLAILAADPVQDVLEQYASSDAEVEAAPAEGRSAKELNQLGFDLYKQKKYKDAQPFFKAAVVADPKWAVPAYNLACALMLGRDECEPPDSALFFLARAIQLDPKRKKKALEDADLAELRPASDFAALTGVDRKKADVIDKLYRGRTLYSGTPGPGVAEGTLKLNADGTAQECPAHEAGAASPCFTGTWKAMPGGITLELDGKKKRTLSVSEGSAGSYGAFRDCSA